MAHFNQYRVSSAAMPNPDKVKSKELLKAKIQEVADARVGKVTGGEKDPTHSTRSTGMPGSNIHSLSSASSSSSSSTVKSSSRKKVVKKPPPNFGGGKLGSS